MFVFNIVHYSLQLNIFTFAYKHQKFCVQSWIVVSLSLLSLSDFSCFKKSWNGTILCKLISRTTPAYEMKCRSLNWYYLPDYWISIISVTVT